MQKLLTTIKDNHKKGTNRKLVNFQVLPDSAHHAELESYQAHNRLDDHYPYHGAHGRLIYDLLDENWMPHIGISNSKIAKLAQKAKAIKK